MADWDYQDEDVADLEDGDFGWYDDSDPVYEDLNLDEAPQYPDEVWGDYADNLSDEWDNGWSNLVDFPDTDESTRATALTEASQRLGYFPISDPITPEPQKEEALDDSLDIPPITQSFPNMPEAQTDQLSREELQAMGFNPDTVTTPITADDLGDIFQRGPVGAVAAVTGVNSLTPNQINDVDGPLSAANALSICGPAAAVAFARRTGKWPSLEEATQMAQSNNWWTPEGMRGPDNEVNLLKSMGVAAKLEWGQTPAGQRNPVYNDWGKVAADVSRGNPVILDSPGHYWVAEDYDPETGRFNFGNSAQIFKASDPNNSWYTAEEIVSRFGEQYRPRAALFLDNPETASPSVVAGSSTGKVMVMKALPYDGPLSIPNDPYKREVIRNAADEFGIHPDIFERQIRQEGGFSQDVWDMQRNSPAAARGPAQFITPTGDAVADQMGIDRNEFWSSPETQVRAGAKHMKDLLDANGGDYAKALAAYNAGQGAVNKYGGVPPYAETQGYISNILGSERPNLHNLWTEAPMGPVTPTSAVPSEQSRDKWPGEQHTGQVAGPIERNAAAARNDDRTRPGAAMPPDPAKRPGVPDWMQNGTPMTPINTADPRSVQWLSQYLQWQSTKDLPDKDPRKVSAPATPPPTPNVPRVTDLDIGAGLQRELNSGRLISDADAKQRIAAREDEVAQIRKSYIERNTDAATLRDAEVKLAKERQDLERRVAGGPLLDRYQTAVQRAKEENIPLLPPPPGGGVIKPYDSSTSTLPHSMDPDRSIDSLMVNKLDLDNASGPNAWVTAEKMMRRNSESSNYVIQPDGRVVRLVPEQFVTNMLNDPENERNGLSVSLLTDKSSRGGYTRQQLESLRWLMAESQRRWGVTNMTTAQDLRDAVNGKDTRNSRGKAIGFDYDWFDDFATNGWSFGPDPDYWDEIRASKASKAV